MGYVTTAEVVAEGVPGTVPIDKVTAAIALWSSFIDRACRQFFEKRTITIDLDGSGSDVLFLPVPIINVTSLYVNANFTTAVDPSSYKVYNRRTPPFDDRKNPRIRLAQTSTIFDPLYFPQRPIFVQGRQNQRIVGDWGYVESDAGYSTPPLIKRAVIRLVIRDLINQHQCGGLWAAIEGGPIAPVGPKVFEMTDGHSVQYASAVKNLSKPGYAGITNDPEVDAIIQMYRSPISIAVPHQMLLFGAAGGFSP